MKIALVYDWVTTRYGGAEKVLVALHQAFPDAPLYTAVADLRQAKWAMAFDVRTTWLQRIPVLNRHHRWLAPLLPLAFESLDLSEYDVVISITSSQAKGVLTRADQLHICYVLTPPRYLYSHAEDYAESHFQFPGSKWLRQIPMRYLKWWDQAIAHRPDVTIPISQRVADRCLEFYTLKTNEAIYPPVEKLTTAKPNNDGYYLVLSRLVPYKRIDVAIEACIELDRSLVIVGEGPDRSRLENSAKGHPNITFVGSVSDAEVSEWLQSARGVLMPGLEDFGIVAGEAVASGVPVVLHRQSGAAELIANSRGGIYLKDSTVRQVVSALRLLEEKEFNPSQLQQSMRKYATTTFVKKWQTTVNQLWSLFQEKGLL